MRPSVSGIGETCNSCAASVRMIRWRVVHRHVGLVAMADEREGRLLSAAGLFLFLYALILTLAPAVREHSWQVSFRYAHWAGLAAWAVGVWLAHRLIARRLPERDPFLLPLAALLSGWGLMTVWRLEPALGLRQSAWLLVSLAAFVVIPYFSEDLAFLRRY